MIDWEHTFTNWLDERLEEAEQYDFRYVVVIEDKRPSPDDPTFGVSFMSGFFSEYPEEYDERDDAQVFEVDSGTGVTASDD